jgi:GTP-binding protein
MIDSIKFGVKGGKGGDGVISFRREKFVPHGGPNGGDGGDGGSVFLVATQSLTTLAHLRNYKHYRAQNGSHGRGKNQHGKNGRDLILKVPLGTLVKCEENNQEMMLGDLTTNEQALLVAKGGRGGWGNAHFATPSNQAPRIANKGRNGEERLLVLELKLLADVGIIGYPNVGKSTLLSRISKAKPKVADYPFTTTEPVLGVVEVGYRSFVIAEIPGLIEGAHQGHGLGDYFLRHSERTKVLIHLLDGSADDPLHCLHRINEELRLFSPALGEKPQLIAVNKVDIPSVRARLVEIREKLEGEAIPVCFISAVTGEGIPELLYKVAEIVERFSQVEMIEEVEFKVFRPKLLK